MDAEGRNIKPEYRPIRQLDEATANRIAAGDVVERPASAVKELVENALDAGATRVDVAYADGGRRLIRVSDDGHGIPAAELPLALARHATSKTDGADLMNVRSFGFRGEALPSLGAVGRLRLTSRHVGAGEAAEIRVEDGRIGPVRPAALSRGTVVELRDLFHATPARLKFMRSDRAEAQAIADVVRRLAMAAAGVALTLTDVSDEAAPRLVLRLDAETGDLFGRLKQRLRRLLGPEFVQNALPIDARRDDLHLTGFAALPTYSRGAAVAQYLFVNGRPVRDKLMLGALRAGYADVLARDRHPAAVLDLACEPLAVDVNVHPAKAEVRFREPGPVRGLIVAALRQALAGAGHRSATTTGPAMLGAARPAGGLPHRPVARPSPGALEAGWTLQAPAGFAEDPAPAPARPGATEAEEAGFPLGAARAQLHRTYLIAETADGLVIVDQHAAHERLVYERLKAEHAATGVRSQLLLIPEIVELGPGDRERLAADAGALTGLGLVVEPFGGGAVCVREVPAILADADVPALIRDIADELADGGAGLTLAGRIDAVLSRMSCHGSVRAGRPMSGPEMNALLREIEATPFSGQCNHGRPTHVELKLADIERLFGRR
jgi:DNA mismatch repair protein MutL